jgi:dihydropteroate synthase
MEKVVVLIMTVDKLETWLRDEHRPPLVMGVVNVTPDSFSDGGSYLEENAAIEHAERLVADGADMIDVGAESTRPGSAGVPAEEQLRRLVPVLSGIRKRLPSVVISIDTTSAAVALEGLKNGGNIVNDISGGTFERDMLDVVARGGAKGIILMHMQGTPATMQVHPTYRDVTGEVVSYLQSRVEAAVEAGMERWRVMVDPGIGFGKTVEHNLTLLRDMGRMVREVGPVVIGTSRKGFIGKVTGESGQRLFGTAATVAHSVANGAAVVRVHDVREMAMVVRMMRAILRGM